MIPYLNALDASSLPLDWQDAIADHETGVAPRLIRALAAHNLSVYVGHDLRIIADIQARNAEKMKRLAECCDPELNPRHGPDDTIVVVLVNYGVRVGCTALRLKWVEESLREAIETGSVMAERSFSPGQPFACTAPTADLARSCPVLWSGGSFTQDVLPDIAFPAMFRLGLILGFIKWRWQWTAGICDWDLGRNPWSFGTLGMSRVENGVSRLNESRRYLMVAAHRQEFKRLALHPTYGDPTIVLGDPAIIGVRP